MATGTSPPPLPPSHQRDVAGYSDFVDQHLAKVRNGIRVSDFFAKAMGLGALILLYLLGLIVIDHWVTDLGTVGRVLGLAGLILGSGFYVVRYLVPDLLRKINPAYAAQMVEQSEPSLRNSLINLVLLRPKRDSVREVIYEQVEQQAATRLSHVDVGDAVDQTPLIRLALCLLGAMILFAAYTIFSPKSPFQSIARIVSPFSEMSRPARVRISDIQPRNTTVFAGESVEVSAIVDLDDESEPVWLIYSTTDGQQVDVRRPMVQDPISMRHVALPNDDGLITQTIDYRIVAGDAEEGPFRITVSQAPTIFVEQLVLDYPKYTELPSETLDNQADVRALDGTRVTVRARANHDIADAVIELDPQAKRPTRLKMTSNGRTAEGSFLIHLREDRSTPLNESYRLSFTTAEGKVSQDAVEHTIEVLPDLAPQVEILTPTTREIEVPQNAQQIIEVRGLDPDYGLADLRVQAAYGRTKIVDHSLLSEPGLGQRVGKFVFRPREYQLQPGDEVVYIGLAKDNRTDAKGSFLPNVTATERYKIRITEPREVPPNEGEGLEQDDGRNDQPKPDDAGENGEGDEADGQGDEGAGAEGGGADDQEGEGGDGQDGEVGGGEKGEGQDGNNEGEGEEGEGQDGAGANGEGAEGEGQEGDDAGEGAEGEGANREGANGEGNGLDGDKAEAGEGEGDGAGPDQEGEGGELGGDGDPQAGPKENGEGGAGDPQNGAPGGEAAEGGNDPTTNAKGQQPQDGDPQGKQPGEGADAGDADENGEPLDPNGADDGDAFERIVERMKEKFGESADGTPKPCPNGECANEGGGEGSENPGQGGEASDSQGEAGSEKGDKPGGEKGENGKGKDGEKGEGEKGEGEKGEGEKGEGEKGEGETGAGQQGTGEQGKDGEKSEGEKGKGDQGKGGDNGADEKGDGGDQPGGEKGDQPGGENAADNQQGDGQDGGEGGEQGKDGNADKGQGGDKGEGGENGDKPGANGQPSGKGGNQPGEKGNEQGENPEGDNDGEAQPGEQGANGAADGNSGDPAAGEAQPGAQAPNAPDGNGDWFDDAELPEPGGDDPNLEYARKATDLALDYLEHNEDEQLKNELGWSDEEMKSFVKRWQEMQDGATATDPAESERELNDALRSLGLRRGNDRLRQSNSKDDRTRVRDSGTRSQPPAEYVDQYRAYLKSLGRRPKQ